MMAMSEVKNLAAHQRLQNIADSTRLHILPGKPGPFFKEKEIFNRVYDEWFTYWSQLLTNIKSTDRLNSDEFFRQDYVLALMSGERIAGTI